MKEIINHYKSELATVEKELLTAPPGRLVRRTVKERMFYSQFVDGQSINLTEFPYLIKEHARKKLQSVRAKQLLKNIEIIEQVSRKVKDPSIHKMISELSATYNELPTEYFYHPEIADWVADDYSKNSFKEEDAIYYSTAGTAFRSKSEREIGNILEEYGLPYRYDAVITVGGRRISPDFIIKNPFNGRTFTWEHFGAFNQENYANRMNDKMDLYYRNGYIEGENLIVTFEYHVRRPERIKELIEQIIL